MKRVVVKAGSSLFAVACALALGSCATVQPVKVGYVSGKGTAEVVVPKQNGDRKAAPSRPVTVTVPLVTYRRPDEGGREKKGGKGETPRQVVASANLRFVIKPTVDTYRGGAVVYPWIPNHMYQLFVAPLMATDITLEPGEKIVSPPAAGDTDDFEVGVAYSMMGGQEKVEHVDIKAVYPDKRTTLEIYTNRRTYTFSVYSYRKTYMPMVSFTYPLEIAQAMKQSEEQARQRLLMYGDITDLRFDYKIIPHSVVPPPWIPSKVFSDGERTYIDFPSAGRLSYAPVLFSVGPEGKLTLVQYHVIGDYYVVDQVLRDAQLVLGVQDGDIVSIMREN